MTPERMHSIETRVKEEIRGEVKGSDSTCDHYPCHFEGQDCTFCYCPLYPCLDCELGVMLMGRRDQEVWSCKNCFFVHRHEVVKELHIILEPFREHLPTQDEKDAILKELGARFGKRPHA